MTAALVSEPNQFLFDCHGEGINVCQYTMNTQDIALTAITCTITMSSGGSVYLEPGASGFTPANPQTCSSYITAGFSTTLVETISSFRIEPTKTVTQMYLDPNLAVNQEVMFMQLAMLGEGAVATAQCFFISPAQLVWDTTVSCGPGSASARPDCGSPKSADINTDGKVNIIDIILVLDNYGACDASVGICDVVDLDCNGLVDLWDISLVLQNWMN
jgi:hypothetical protein